MTQQLSRREFIRSSGALVVSFSGAGALEPLAFASTSLGVGGQGQFGTRASHIDPRQLDSWIAVNADDTITAYTGKCELGQGMNVMRFRACPALDAGGGSGIIAGSRKATTSSVGDRPGA